MSRKSGLFCFPSLPWFVDIGLFADMVSKIYGTRISFVTLPFRMIVKRCGKGSLHVNFSSLCGIKEKSTTTR